MPWPDKQTYLELFDFWHETSHRRVDLGVAAKERCTRVN